MAKWKDRISLKDDGNENSPALALGYPLQNFLLEKRKKKKSVLFKPKFIYA